MPDNDALPGSASRPSGSVTKLPASSESPKADGDSESKISPPLSIRRFHFEKNISKSDFRNRHLLDVNGKNTEFINCDFSYSIFERAYFRNATFKNCRFVGAKFIDSNFREAHFFQCDFRYAEFRLCLLDSKEVVASLPYEPNIRTEALRHLRANAVSMGDYKAQGFLVLQEIEASRDHNYRALTGVDSYYKAKYPSIFDKAKAAGRLLLHYASSFLWGHGEKPFHILTSAAVLLLFISFVNFWSVMPRVGWNGAGEGLWVVRYVVELFLGLNPLKTFAGFWWADYLIVIIRYLYIGLFISVLSKKISHR